MYKGMALSNMKVKTQKDRNFAAKIWNDKAT